jgi:hypothetical protein
MQAQSSHRGGVGPGSPVYPDLGSPRMVSANEL